MFEDGLALRGACLEQCVYRSLSLSFRVQLNSPQIPVVGHTSPAAVLPLHLPNSSFDRVLF